MKKHALLFSGGIDTVHNYRRYAYDLSFAYTVLKDKMGFKTDEIELLYADGADISLNGINLKTKKADKLNFNNAVLKQYETMSDKDIFLLLVTNHGFKDGSICTWGAGSHCWLKQNETEHILNKLKCIKLLIFGQCYGGNYLLSDTINNAVIISANKPNKESYARPIKAGNKFTLDNYDEFIYNFFSYYNGAYPSGGNLYADNQNKSVMKAFEYARQYDSYLTASVSPFNFTEEPCIKNNLLRAEDLGSLVFSV